MEIMEEVRLSGTEWATDRQCMRPPGMEWESCTEYCKHEVEVFHI